MSQHWRIAIRSTKRGDVDPQTLVQVVVALGRQLHQEEHHEEVASSGSEEEAENS